MNFHFESISTFLPLHFSCLPNYIDSLFHRYSDNVFQRSTDQPPRIRAKALEDQCPTLSRRRCSTSSKKYRTADGSCNNLKHPWRGSSMMPLQRFLPPRYDDGELTSLSIKGTILKVLPCRDTECKEGSTLSEAS